MNDNGNGELFKLVTKVKHRFPLSPRTVPAAESRSGHPQSEKTCELCGAVKVTIHMQGSVFRAWRISEAAPQVLSFLAPDCEPTDPPTTTKEN